MDCLVLCAVANRVLALILLHYTHLILRIYLHLVLLTDMRFNATQKQSLLHEREWHREINLLYAGNPHGSTERNHHTQGNNVHALRQRQDDQYALTATMTM